MMDLQKVMDMIFSASAAERSKYHLTLGELRDALAEIPDDFAVEFEDGVGICELSSYRGFYEDLALEPAIQGGNPRALVVKKAINAAIGKVFTGYKGGDYTMTEKTPLWRAEYGDTGLAVTSCVKLPGKLVLVTKQIDD